MNKYVGNVLLLHTPQIKGNFKNTVPRYTLVVSTYHTAQDQDLKCATYFSKSRAVCTYNIIH